MAASAPRMGPSHGIAQRLRVREPLDPRGRGNSVSSVLYGFKHVPRPYGAHVTRAMSPEPCVLLCVGSRVDATKDPVAVLSSHMSIYITVRAGGAMNATSVRI